MKKKLSVFKKKLQNLSVSKPEYKALKAHLNKQPVGYPRTLTGVENRLLTEIFTPIEASTALYLTSHFETLETIHKRSKEDGVSTDDLKQRLENMGEKGCIFIRYRNKIAQYALHPFVVGMFEMQLYRLTPGYFMDTLNYGIQGFGMEYLSTKVPQMRIIPIEKSINVEHNIATYDEVRTLVDSSPNNLRLVSCVCKSGKDLLDESCKITKRREVCLLLHDFADSASRRDWGHKVKKAEAMEMLAQGEKEGLMLMTSNMKEPQVICSCCGCCCGITSTIRSMPRPSDFTASNFTALFDQEACNGCKKCLKRCQMKAFILDQNTKKPIGINSGKCVGCGLCVFTCKTKAITLNKKEQSTVPPQNHDELYEIIANGKKSTFRKAVHLTKAMSGMKT
ncbi:MAG: 4Fe-4S ferredoxin [Lentisphaerae bacterium]|nr:4Fe-4S ferredoxin [Lentisphaerota bacterium]